MSHHNEITNLLGKYCHLVDRGQPQEVAQLFAEDAVLLPKYDGPYRVEGRDAIQGWYQFYTDNFKVGIRHLKHLIHSIVIDVDDSGVKASGMCYLTAYLISNADGMAHQAQGTYFDTYVQQNGEWLFSQREINVEFLTDCGAPVEQLEPLGFPTS
ncbi:MAG: nuclear transport factor 2 family protein [Pseudomonadota bacterium]